MDEGRPETSKGRSASGPAVEVTDIVCQFGRLNGVYTLRVDDFVDREEEFMNDILAG